MAKILTFRAAELRRHERAGIACEGASAEVIVFPGIRYEHWDEPKDAASQAAKNRQQRDVLELAE